MKLHTKLTARERDQIALYHTQRISNSEIARRLGREVSTIGREIKRNRLGNTYVAIHAQTLAQKRSTTVAHSKAPLKNAVVFAYVTEKLRDGWSPDQIAGRLKKNILMIDIFGLPQKQFTVGYTNRSKSGVMIRGMNISEENRKNEKRIKEERSIGLIFQIAFLSTIDQSASILDLNLLTGKETP